MWAVRLFALLLPLGVWLVHAGATSRDDEPRAAASGLISLAAATLGYVAIGFGFMFGGIGAVAGAVAHLPDLGRYVTYYTLPVANQSWGIIGLRGFFLSGVDEANAIQLFVTYLPLTITCAMLVTNLLAFKAPVGVQVIVTLVLSGLLFPIIGFWMWGGGWLATMGVNLNLGHGAVDIGGLTTAALVAGGAGLAALVFLPRRPADEQPALPATYHPFRSLSGLIFALVGTAAIVAGNPLHGAADEHIAAALLLNAAVAVSIAVLTALAYTAFTTRRFDLSAAARAALGALIASSAGSLLLPTWAALLLGVITGLLATVGLYVTNDILRWRDDAGLISSTLVPGVLGLLFMGLFANGAFGRGLNGIGMDSYLGAANLGVVGLLPLNGATGDAGQLTAQLVAALIVPGVSFVLCVPVALLLRRLPIPQPLGEVVQPAQAMPQPGVTVASQPITRPSAPALTLATSELAVPVEVATRVEQPASLVLVTNQQSSAPEAILPVAQADKAVNEAPATQAAAPKRKESLLERLRRARNGNPEPERPVQARHVAYPNRVGGRRLSIRPMTKVDDASTAESGKPAR